MRRQKNRTRNEKNHRRNWKNSMRRKNRSSSAPIISLPETYISSRISIMPSREKDAMPKDRPRCIFRLYRRRAILFMLRPPANLSASPILPPMPFPHRHASYCHENPSSQSPENLLRECATSLPARRTLPENLHRQLL